MKTDPLQTYAFKLNFPFNTEDLSGRVSSVPAETQPGEYFACWVNHLTDWVLSGTQTVQLMLAQRNVACRIEFDEPIYVKRTKAGMVFETWIAAHRAVADLNIVFTNESTGGLTRHTVPFDGAFGGGSARDGYQHVSIPLPDGFEKGTVGIAVDYKAYLSTETDIEPFLFIADTRVSQSTNNEPSLVEPIRVRHTSDATEGTWMTGPLPSSLMVGDDVILKSGRNTEKLLTTRVPKLALEEDYGHTLIMSSDIEMDVLLHIDGKPIERLMFGPNNNIVRLSAQFLDGHSHHVCFKDRSGTITFWQGQLLLPAIITPRDIMQRETPAPFPSTLFAQTPQRYASLKASVAAADENTDHAQLAYALSVLEGGYENVKLKPLTFNRPEKPDVSIVIPAHNKVEVTYLALCSLLVAYNKASFEVIVVDDASTDETTELENIVSGITVLHNELPQRFIRACNRGAQEAKGDYIVLLNNDVEVTSGWLDELIGAFDRFDNVGMAGSKLLYPNGQLQDAGGIIWGTGNPWNYGNQQNPEEPRFSYARQADYLSGAAMMVRADIWRDVGGLSSYMEPMYFEDTDFAFKVREAGFTTWFVPSSVVYHYEGMTSGTDVTSGFKKYQEVNRPKFKRRWAKAFSGFGKEGQRPDLEKDRGIVGRILFIDYSTPRPDQDAGSYAALQEIRLVQSLGYKVSFLPGNMAHLGQYTEELQKMGVEVIYAPFYLSQTEYLTQHARDFDAFYITRYYVAQDVLDRVRALAPEARVLFNNADLHFLREIRAARAEGDAAALEKARQTRNEEMDIINKVDLVLSYNEVEHSVIQAYSDGQAKVMKCPWVVDVPENRAPLKDRKGMSFLGSFRHHPNAEGVQWFVRDILPVVNGVAGSVPLSIYGASMSDEIRALKTNLVDPVGFVEKVEDAFDKHRIFIAPLRSGAGIKGKVLSALSYGIPCVLTQTAAEGIGLRSGHDCFIAETPDAWAKAIKALSEDDDLWTTISDNAQAYMRDAFSFDRGRAQMREAFEAVELYQGNG
ncbi:glycosyltransferase [Tateyamaria omphalii]|uniref:glycosyltransferase n=1 Tax=Tateyamaria omphalii TaxID=299262 RepID=UPI0016769630|nr:glycosyltransferase [Tateyamaria omphalii]